MSSRLDRRIDALEAEIHALRALISGEQPPPGDDAYKSAIEALLDGDRAPLERYLQRTGGKVPQADTIYPNNAGTLLARQRQGHRGGRDQWRPPQGR